ncbi:hypothetical protein AG1IA_08880 [Rhizoctonia solani AG-1 IA]|uniref:Uncharacterized protein n=1 Tax=Thanatephorus cucumeris (strain AG1-IA) TaxID=983506 RepID=L8WL65_THACA|nr:hypothetical protein AG1IA_08880 [Rhizoctonia solani AG-1 IA]
MCASCSIEHGRLGIAWRCATLCNSAVVDEQLTGKLTPCSFAFGNHMSDMRARLEKMPRIRTERRRCARATRQGNGRWDNLARRGAHVPGLLPQITF